MIENVTIPPEMRTVIGPESRDFAVLASRAYPLKVSLTLIVFGIIWLLFTSTFFIAFLGPVIGGKEVELTVDGVPRVAGPDNLEPILVPAIIIGIFVLVGIGVLWMGIYLFTRKGGYFAGTPTRMVIYQNKSIRSIDWEQFSGDIEIKGNNQKGYLSLQLRTGSMVTSKSGSDRFVPDVVYISGIREVFEVEKICRKRIKENDPTPSLA